MATEQQEEVWEFSLEQTIICEGFSQILLPNLKKATRHLPKFQPSSSFPTRPWRKQHFSWTSIVIFGKARPLSGSLLIQVLMQDLQVALCLSDINCLFEKTAETRKLRENVDLFKLGQAQPPTQMFVGQRVTNPYERLEATGQAPLPLTTCTRISACKPCKWEEMNKNAR